MSRRSHSREYDFYNKSQSLYCRAIDRDYDHKLSCLIKRNAYDNQSYAKVEVWNNQNGWLFIRDWPIQAMRAFDYSYILDFEKDIGLKDIFQADADECLDWAVEFLSERCGNCS